MGRLLTTMASAGLLKTSVETFSFDVNVVRSLVCVIIISYDENN